MGEAADLGKAIARLKKGELHVHLNGLISAQLVRTLLIEESIELPAGFDVDKDLVHHSPCPSLASYLSPWKALRRIPSKLENLFRICDDAFASLNSNGVAFVELRSSLLYLSGIQKISVAEALNRLIEATGRSAAKYGIQRGIVLTVTRGDYSATQLSMLIEAYRELGYPPEVVGVDLAGDEETPVSDELPGLFRRVKEKYNLGITIHAGETGRIENIFNAIRDFGADRIGHGTAAGLAPHVMEELCQRDVCVEVCPISNRLTGAVKESDSHPLTEFVRRGVPFVICSDNPGIHERGLNEDYEAALAEGVDFKHLDQQYAMASRYAFLKINNEN